MAEKKQTHINVLTRTQRQIEILKSVRGSYGYELVEAWADQAWAEAKKQGLVTDAMIQPVPSPIIGKQKKQARRPLKR